MYKLRGLTRNGKAGRPVMSAAAEGLGRQTRRRCMPAAHGAADRVAVAVAGQDRELGPGQAGQLLDDPGGILRRGAQDLEIMGR